MQSFVKFYSAVMNNLLRLLKTNRFYFMLRFYWLFNEHILLRTYETKTYLSNRWLDDLRFYVLFNSISVISGRFLDDNERLCAMESVYG